MAVRAAIEACCPGVSARIKWPNDILIEGRKCCGMLLESAIGKEPTETFVVLGIGINVNQASFPAPFDRTASSLMLGCGRPVDRILFLADLLRRLEHLVHRLESGPDRLVRDYEQALEAVGRMCTLTDVHSGARVQGVILGVDAGGALRLETEAGIRLFHAGDVKMLTESA
jgi:BirA family biotin operon repressor/biotin-[acetyl-CoA-carboxylase] ligase